MITKNYFSLVGSFRGEQAYTFEFPHASFMAGGAWASPTIEFNVVPEPSTYALFGLGAIGMLMLMRRKKTA